MSMQDGQSSFQLTSDRDYRRGVILGLTLAEVLLLLVFLLLLAAGSILTHAHEDAVRQADRVADLTSRLTPIIDALSQNGVRVENIDELSTLLRRGQEAEKLRKTVDDMTSALSEARRDSIEKQKAFDKIQTDLAATRLDLANAKSDITTRSDLIAKAEILDRITKTLGSLPGSIGARPEQALANTVGQWREAVDRLKRLGAGGKPVCWARPTGEPEPLFLFELRDDGYRVREPAPRPRPDDPVWALAGGVPRDTLIDLKDINGVISNVVAEANRRQCRFGVIVRDNTGPSNKSQYKKLNYPLYQAFEVKETSQ